MVVGVVMKTGGTGMVGTGVVTVEETVDTVEGASRVPQMIGATGTVADLEATGVEGMASGAAGTGMTGVEMEVTVAGTEIVAVTAIAVAVTAIAVAVTAEIGADTGQGMTEEVTTIAATDVTGA